MTTANRTYAAAHFALELDGKDSVGLFRSIEGGSVKTEVVTYQNGPNYDRWRQLAKPKFEDIKLQVGMSMSKPFYSWIKNFFSGKAERKNGSIIAADFHYKERARREFKDAMIKELTMPRLDATDTKPAYMTVALAVEDIVFKKGSGAQLSAPDAGMEKQKKWQANNFYFELSGFEQACARVSKIDSFTIKQQIIEYHMGGALAPMKAPSAIDFPTIAFYIPEADSLPFLEHFSNDNRLAVKNDIPQASKLHGMLQTWDQAKKDLFTLSFTGADILSVTPDKSESASEEIKHVKVELYTESMTFEYKAT